MNVSTAPTITIQNAFQSPLRCAFGKHASDASELSCSGFTVNETSVSGKSDTDAHVSSATTEALFTVSTEQEKDFLNGRTSCTRRRETIRFTLIDPGVSTPKLVLHLEWSLQVEGVDGDSAKGLLQAKRGFDEEYSGDNPLDLCCIFP